MDALHNSQIHEGRRMEAGPLCAMHDVLCTQRSAGAGAVSVCLCLRTYAPCSKDRGLHEESHGWPPRLRRSTAFRIVPASPPSSVHSARAVGGQNWRYGERTRASAQQARGCRMVDGPASPGPTERSAGPAAQAPTRRAPSGPPLKPAAAPSGRQRPGRSAPPRPRRRVGSGRLAPAAASGTSGRTPARSRLRSIPSGCGTRRRR